MPTSSILACPDCRTFGLRSEAQSALATRVQSAKDQRRKLRDADETLKWVQGFPAPPERAKQEDLTLVTGHLVGRVDELGSLEPKRLAALDDEVQAELAQVFPSLSALADGRGVALQHERHRSHRAVREVLVRLAAPMPLVLVLDDVHWADSASVELLERISRIASRDPSAAILNLPVAAGPGPTPAATWDRQDRQQRGYLRLPFLAPIGRWCGHDSTSAAAPDAAVARIQPEANAGRLLARLASPWQVIPAQTGGRDWDSPLTAIYP